MSTVAAPTRNGPALRTGRSSACAAAGDTEATGYKRPSCGPSGWTRGRTRTCWPCWRAETSSSRDSSGGTSSLTGARASRRGDTRPRLLSFTGSTFGNTCRTCRPRASMPGGTHTGNAANSRLEGMLSSRSATRKVTDRLRLCRHRRPWLRRRNSDPRRANMENPHWLLRSPTDVLVGLYRNSFALSDRSSYMHCRSVVP